MAREDLITKNDAKYIINVAIEHIENEDYPYESVLEMLGGIKEDIDKLIPEEPKPLTPCERDGHNFIDIFSGQTYVYCYCTKCGEKKIIKF